MKSKLNFNVKKAKSPIFAMSVLMDTERPKLENVLKVSSTQFDYTLTYAELPYIMYDFSVGHGTKILLAAGTQRKGMELEDGSQPATRIMDLEDPTFSCEVNHFPVKLGSATGGLIGQTPFVCGGILITSKKACYVLEEQNGEWKEDQIAALNGERWNAATGSVIMNDKLVLAGGFGNGRDKLSTIEMVAPNTKSGLLTIELPVAMVGSCIVPWDNTTFMVIGGYSDSARKETYFFHMGNNTISNGPKLLTERSSHACHEINVNGEEFIVVVGGRKGGKVYTSTEVLPKSSYTNGWQYGKNFHKYSR